MCYVVCVCECVHVSILMWYLFSQACRALRLKAHAATPGCFFDFVVCVVFFRYGQTSAVHPAHRVYRRCAWIAQIVCKGGRRNGGGISFVYCVIAAVRSSLGMGSLRRCPNMLRVPGMMYL